MSLFATEKQRAEHRKSLADLGFDGPRAMGTDPFGREYAVCVGESELIPVGCGCPVMLGDPTPNPVSAEPSHVERGIYLHIMWHQHLNREKDDQ